MTRLLLDPDTLARLKNLAEPLEFCDESGAVLGVFMPTVDEASYRGTDSPASAEELDRSEREPARPLADILRDLEQTA